MSKTQAEILSEIQSSITSNSVGSITGTVLNSVLSDMTTTLNGSNFLYPVLQDGSVTNCDAGALMMNDGSGFAKIYKLSPAQPAQCGLWSIKPDSLSAINDSSGISITNGGNNYTYQRNEWADWPGYTTSVTIAQELNYLCLFLQGQSVLSNLSFYLSGDGNTLFIRELSYQGTIVYVNNMGAFPLQQNQRSLPALSAAPTAFPLGKLIAIVDGQALISCNVVDTYNLVSPMPSGIMNGSFSVLNNLFNYSSDITVTDAQSIFNVLNQIIVPADNGTVSPFNINDLNLNNGILQLEFRHQFLGLAIASTDTTVTVYNVSFLSHLLSIFVRAVNSGILQFGSENNAGYSHPAMGSGSGIMSGSGSGSSSFATAVAGPKK